jgi:hypothetical protein
MLNTFEMDTIAEIKARVANKQHVADWEKQMVLDLLRREGRAVRADVVERARRSGFNVEGIKTL